MSVEHFLRRGQDHLQRLQRGTATAAKTEIFHYLRENDIGEELLTKDEYESAISIVEDVQKRTRLHQVPKRYLIC